jgi:hypothetical protein
VESIDRRSRLDDGEAITPDRFLDEVLPDLLAAHGELLADAMRGLALRPLAFNVGDRPFSLRLRGAGPAGRVVPESGLAAGALVLDLDEAQFSDFVLDQRSLNSFSVNRDVRMHSATMAQILDWDVAWRALLDGWPAHHPGGLDLSDLDLHRSFTPDDDPADLGRYLRDAGYLHLSGWLDPELMATIAADMDEALPAYRPDDGRSWWATLSNGEQRCVRMLHFVERSEATAAMLTGPEWERLRLAVAGADALDPPKPEGNVIEALVKPIGVTQGISDIPWHRDCSLGRHSYMCCTLTVGVSVTDGGADQGQLRVLAGSHRANVPAVGVAPGLDLPIVPLPTRAGDLTVHLSCTLHEATPPVSGERKVMYTGFRLPEASSGSAAAAQAWARRNAAHKLQSQAPSPVAAR